MISTRWQREGRREAELARGILCQVDKMAGWDSTKAWRHLRLEMEASKHYWRSNRLYGMARPNILVDRFLPGLLYIKAVALLDEALDQWLDSAGHKLVKPYRDDLNGRLEYLGDKQLLLDVKPLHLIRQMRNTLAHETGASCTWDELERDTSTIEAALLHRLCFLRAGDKNLRKCH
jgi:hypothetical protein